MEVHRLDFFHVVIVIVAVVALHLVINYDLGEKKSCEFVDIGISYDSDIDVAKKIMQVECENHRDNGYEE